MKPFDLALIGVRIVAVYLVAQSLKYFPMFAQTMLSGLTADFRNILPATLFTLAPLTVAWLLWIMAPRIAEKATFECTEEASEIRFDQQDLIASGLVIIGVYLFATSFPILIYNFPNVFRIEPPGVDFGGPWDWFATHAIICIFAILLILGSKNIVRNVLRFRRAGL